MYFLIPSIFALLYVIFSHTVCMKMCAKSYSHVCIQIQLCLYYIIITLHFWDWTLPFSLFHCLLAEKDNCDDMHIDNTEKWKSIQNQSGEVKGTFQVVWKSKTHAGHQQFFCLHWSGYIIFNCKRLTTKWNGLIVEWPLIVFNKKSRDWYRENALKY